ncbi:DUF3329 domain-containing protein [Roseinatronobacter sp. NSM]|uniref:DUF3329 domain-containing protein n=1 Tax=Roseinatronobacter sp. NSM TaxID=3457785 RepID=UPI0040365E08
MFDFSHAIYRPLWVRFLLVVVALGWGVFEFASGAPFFGVIFVGVGFFVAWRFFVAFDQSSAGEKDE